MLVESLLGAGPGRAVLVEGAEARHAARVKRVEVGERVGLMDGKGGIASGRVGEIRKAHGAKGEWEVLVHVDEVRAVPPLTPRLEVWSAPPEGDRLASMIDALGQAGAALWRPLITERTQSSVSPARLERLGRLVLETAKQSGRPWAMEVGEEISFRDALRAEGVRVLIAHAGHDDAGDVPFACAPTRLLVGPEGGWSPRELDLAAAQGVTPVRLGAFVMRIETAAVAGAALLLRGARV